MWIVWHLIVYTRKVLEYDVFYKGMQFYLPHAIPAVIPSHGASLPLVGTCVYLVRDGQAELTNSVVICLIFNVRRC